MKEPETMQILLQLIRDFDKLFQAFERGTALNCPSGSPDAFLPASTTRASLSNDISVIARTHVASIGIADS